MELSGLFPAPAAVACLGVSPALPTSLTQLEVSRASFEIVTGLNVVLLLQMEREPAPAEGPTLAT